MHIARLESKDATVLVPNLITVPDCDLIAEKFASVYATMSSLLLHFWNLSPNVVVPCKYRKALKPSSTACLGAFVAIDEILDCA